MNDLIHPDYEISFRRRAQYNFKGITATEEVVGKIHVGLFAIIQFGSKDRR